MQSLLFSAIYHSRYFQTKTEIKNTCMTALPVFFVWVELLAGLTQIKEWQETTHETLLTIPRFRQLYQKILDTFLKAILELEVAPN